MDVRSMTHLLVVGGIASVHEIARRLGAELTLVKTGASQTMLAPDAYARIVDVSDREHSDRVRLADEVRRLSPERDSTGSCASTTRPLNSAHS